MSNITDNELIALTLKMMEKTTEHYLETHSTKNSDEFIKLIEKDVSMRIADILPDRYTEVSVDATSFFGDVDVAVVFKTDAGFELSTSFTNTKPYDPTSITENFYFPNPAYNKGRGSKVETLPEALWAPEAGTKRGIVNDLSGIVNDLITKPITLGVSSRGAAKREMENSELKNIFMMGAEKNTNGRIYPNPPTDYGTMTKKTPVGSEKATVDFAKISLLSPPEVGAYAGYSAGTWAGIDLAKVDVHQECIDQAAKEIRNRIDREILESIRIAAAKDAMKWAVPTFGWTEEATAWAAPEAISWKTHASMLGYSATPSDFGGVITTDAAAPVWYNPTSNKIEERVEFTEEDLDLLDMTGSQVMEFA